MDNNQKPKAIYQPGELDKTRRNLGNIDPQEAMRVASILGGEIGVEKEPQYENIRKIKKAPSYVQRDAHIQEKLNQKKTTVSPEPQTIKETTPLLPKISAKEKSLIDKLMANPEYAIKSPQTILSLIFSFAKRNADTVSPEFINNTLREHINHYDQFLGAINLLIKCSSDNYKNNIENKTELKWRFLKTVSRINLQRIKLQLSDFQKNPKQVSVANLIPFTKELYNSLYRFYFLGDQIIISLIKEIYADIIKNTNVSQEVLFKYAKNASSEWIYVSGQIIKGLYPLLMRMCTSEFQTYPSFFNASSSKILQFLELTKYDILLPESNEEKEQATPKRTDPSPQEKAQLEAEAKQINDEKNKNVQLGLEILDTLFPGAGWKNISYMPDMYPYFQPLYNFSDGFNLISPENPLQITIILIRILEDFFQAERHIKFTIEKEPDFAYLNEDSSQVFADWSRYRESKIERTYLAELKDYVSHIYTQPDYKRSTFAKRKLMNMLWLSKNIFLPNLKFELLFIEKPPADDSIKPLFRRTEFLKVIFSTALQRAENAKKTTGSKNIDTSSLGVSNIFEPYQFDIPNVISTRLDVLLGGRKSSSAINLQLLKYSYLILNVLHWWITDTSSPSYNALGSNLYRTEDGDMPIFSVKTRKDQQDLFIRNVKNKIAERKNQAQKEDLSNK